LVVCQCLCKRHLLATPKRGRVCLIAERGAGIGNGLVVITDQIR
jgi:hypothetical protein